ncbi:uncharacterized protein PSFLO_06623 [Pseudozyma flocculosa]|uniref:Uncharacterized protein n=1 Tax=Pseudozyma flocculosa TaxID=84751 RepID=A0A5C3FCG6_9BASI|nr:uncharacterized protein PSFLO_06623 [Pseudozyma flocculosa]
MATTAALRLELEAHAMLPPCQSAHLVEINKGALSPVVTLEPVVVARSSASGAECRSRRDVRKAGWTAAAGPRVRSIACPLRCSSAARPPSGPDATRPHLPRRSMPPPDAHAGHGSDRGPVSLRLLACRPIQPVGPYGQDAVAEEQEAVLPRPATGSYRWYSSSGPTWLACFATSARAPRRAAPR